MSRSVARALELSQRKTATEVETDLRQYFDEKFASLDDKFVTKKEFHDFRADIFKWMFIFWSSQLLAIAGMLFGLLKVLKP